MTKTLMPALILALGIASVPVAAQDEAQSEKQAENKKKQKKICRTEKVTGSLTRINRICLTRAEWDELAARTKKGVDELQGSAAGAKTCGYEAGETCY